MALITIQRIGVVEMSEQLKVEKLHRELLADEKLTE